MVMTLAAASIMLATCERLKKSTYRDDETSCERKEENIPRENIGPEAVKRLSKSTYYVLYRPCMCCTDDSRPRKKSK